MNNCLVLPFGRVSFSLYFFLPSTKRKAKEKAAKGKRTNDKMLSCRLSVAYLSHSTFFHRRQKETIYSYYSAAHHSVPYTIAYFSLGSMAKERQRAEELPHRNRSHTSSSSCMQERKRIYLCLADCCVHATVSKTEVNLHPFAIFSRSWKTPRLSCLREEAKTERNTRMAAEAVIILYVSSNK
jgi:hypothetical protein